MKKKKIITRALFVLFAAIFCFSCYKLIDIRLDYRKNEQIYDEAIDDFLIYNPTTPAATATSVTTAPPSAPAATDAQATETSAADQTHATQATVASAAATTEPQPATTTVQTAPPVPTAPDFAVDWAALKAKNPDIVAWIWQAGTAINYPVLAGNDNEQYLYTTYNHQYSPFGSIFLDYRTALSALNPVIYGHNVGSGKMFASLLNYRKPEYFRQNPYFYILTENGTEKYAIFSAYKVKTDSDSYTFSFDSDGAYADYVRKILLRSAYDMGVSVTEDDEILTLSTCTNTGEEDRFIVHAKRIDW